MKSYITEKENRIVAKLKYPDGTFKKSVIVPTDYYPLNGEQYKFFHCENTERVDDELLLMLLDQVDYRIGYCYNNTEEVVNVLKEKGYDVKSYDGWLFLSEQDFPIHHCWAVVEDKYVIDLADDFSMMLSGENYKNFKGLNYQDAQQTILSFAKEAKNQKNHVRCHPVGTPTPFLYYIGSECEPQEGRKIYQTLLKKYPDHECQRNCNRKGLNPTQKLLAENGLMEL